MPEEKRETYVRVLDFLPRGHPEDKRPAYQKERLIQTIGEEGFVLLEVVPGDEVEEVPRYERLYVGEGERDVVDHVKRRIGYEDLTHSAQAEVPYVVEEIVKEDEDRFVDFFNRAQPISTRQHMLELLQGIGKKLMWAIVEERKKGDFESFEDLEERVPELHHPEKPVTKRIVQEVEDGSVKYYVFTRAPKG
ncbi:MAG: hypothetical protein MAG715_01194 [Methanonatronarchaeales archaeon]|nr:hypothetical protein [Methanonatronarchaeales archaeon]